MSNTNEFIIDTELNTDGAVTGAKDLVKHLKLVSQTVEGVSKTTKVAFKQVVSELDSTSKAYDRQKAKVDELQKKYDSMDKVNISKEYLKELEKELKLEDKRNDLLTKAEQIEQSNKSSKQKKTAIDNIKQQIALLEKQKVAQADVLEFMRMNGEQYDRSKSDAVLAQLDEEKAKLNELASAVKQKAIDATDAEKQVEEESNRTESRLSRIIGTAKKVGSTITKAFGKTVKGAIDGVRNGVDRMKKAFENSNKGIKGGFKNMLKYAFGIRSVFVLVNRLRNALKEGLSNYAQVDNTTNKSISNLKSSLTQLKNSFATAFAPLVNIVAPILTGFINQLSQAITMIGMLIAKLNGATSFKRAKAVQEDYAKSLDKTSKSAKTATLSIDELNIVSEDTSGGGTSPSDMFEDVPIESSVSTLADKIKEMFKDGDFTELGRALGDSIVNALDNLDGKWPQIHAKAEKIGKSIGTFLNGFFETPELGKKLGKSIGNALNTGLSLSSGFVKNTHFDSIGKFFGESINGGLETFDFKKFADTISTGLSGVVDGIYAFLFETDWQKIGDTISDFIADIDWGGIATSVARGIGGAFASLGELVYGFIEDAVRSIRDYFADYIDKYIAMCPEEENLGYYIIAGILDGILNAVANIGIWIYDNIFKPFIDGFKEAFDIHSPSRVMAEQGGFLMAGLLEGITDHIKPIIDKFNYIKTEIVKIITKLKDSVVKLWNDMWDGVKSLLNTFLSGVEAFCNAIVHAINTVFEWLNNLNIDVPDWVTEKFGITSFGFSIPLMADVSIPRLATGTVVPRQSQEFMAILGDNNKETEVVSPLSTIQEAVADVLEPYLKELVDKTQQLIEKDNDVYIGDKDIARANRRGEKKLGYVMTL